VGPIKKKKKMDYDSTTIICIMLTAVASRADDSCCLSETGGNEESNPDHLMDYLDFSHAADDGTVNSGLEDSVWVGTSAGTGPVALQGSSENDAQNPANGQNANNINSDDLQAATDSMDDVQVEDAQKVDDKTDETFSEEEEGMPFDNHTNRNGKRQALIQSADRAGKRPASKFSGKQPAKAPKIPASSHRKPGATKTKGRRKNILCAEPGDIFADVVTAVSQMEIDMPAVEAWTTTDNKPMETPVLGKASPHLCSSCSFFQLTFLVSSAPAVQTLESTFAVLEMVALFTYVSGKRKATCAFN
jgi:hypothetical protein